MKGRTAALAGGAHPVLLLAVLLCGLACRAVIQQSTSSNTSAAGDREALLALHAEVMDAHRTGDIDLLLRPESDDYVVASRGQVSFPTTDERRGFLGPYLRATTFTEYEDVTPPVVSVSADGTLGWVVVQVRASGTQKSETDAVSPIAFESAWVELYEKRAGAWRRVGNVSNFKP